MGEVSSSEFVLALAQGLTGVVAIAASVLAFLVGRAAVRRRTGDRVYEAHLAGIAVTGLYLLASAALGWWAWCEAASIDSGLLFGWPIGTWLWLLFAPLVGMGGVSLLVSGVVLFGRVRKSRAARWRP